MSVTARPKEVKRIVLVIISDPTVVAILISNGTKGIAARILIKRGNIFKLSGGDSAKSVFVCPVKRNLKTVKLSSVGKGYGYLGNRARNSDRDNGMRNLSFIKRSY